MKELKRSDLNQKRIYLSNYGYLKSVAESYAEEIEDYRLLNEERGRISERNKDRSLVLNNLVQKLQDYHVALEEVTSAINAIADPYLKKLLYLRYVDGMNWNNIGVKMGLSRTSVWRYHREALEMMEIPCGRENHTDFRNSEHYATI